MFNHKGEEHFLMFWRLTVGRLHIGFVGQRALKRLDCLLQLADALGWEGFRRPRVHFSVLDSRQERLWWELPDEISSSSSAWWKYDLFCLIKAFRGKGGWKRRRVSFVLYVGGRSVPNVFTPTRFHTLCVLRRCALFEGDRKDTSIKQMAAYVGVGNVHPGYGSYRVDCGFRLSGHRGERKAFSLRRFLTFRSFTNRALFVGNRGNRNNVLIKRTTVHIHPRKLHLNRDSYQIKSTD